MGDGEEGESGVVEERDPGVLETDPTGRFSRVRAPTPPPGPRGFQRGAVCKRLHSTLPPARRGAFLRGPEHEPRVRDPPRHPLKPTAIAR